MVWTWWNSTIRPAGEHHIGFRSDAWRLGQAWAVWSNVFYCKRHVPFRLGIPPVRGCREFASLELHDVRKVRKLRNGNPFRCSCKEHGFQKEMDSHHASPVSLGLGLGFGRDHVGRCGWLWVPVGSCGSLWVIGLTAPKRRTTSQAPVPGP